MLKAIYFPDSNILSAEVGGHPSQVWWAILEGRDVLLQGIIRRVGDGATTRIWQDNWIPRNGTMRPIACLSANPPQLVSDLIDGTNASWRKELVE